MIVPDGYQGDVLMHHRQILICPVLCVTLPVVVQRGEFGVFGRHAPDTSAARAVLVDVVSQVDGIIGVAVDDGARVATISEGDRVMGLVHGQVDLRGKEAVGVVGTRVYGAGC